MAWTGLAIVSAASSVAQVPSGERVERPASARGVAVVPDRYVRPWDPVTIFFPDPVGPTSGAGARGEPIAAESVPVSIDPAQPGVFTWLDRRTLQFRPVDPWPALEAFTVRPRGGSATRLLSLAPAPIATAPEANAEGVDVGTSVTLYFREPVDPEALARAVTVELEPLGAVGASVDGPAGSSGSRWLDRRDLVVRPLEREGRDRRAGYALDFVESLPAGHRVRVALQLSLEGDAPSAGAPTGRLRVLEFTTVEPFRPLSIACGSGQWPIAPRGVVFERPLACPSASLRLRFSAVPAPLDPAAARAFLRFEPSVDRLDVTVDGDAYVIRADLEPERLYRLHLTPPTRTVAGGAPDGAMTQAADVPGSAASGPAAASIVATDRAGRPLRMEGTTVVPLRVAAAPSFARWDTGRGVAERRGPKEVPLVVRGDRRVDLRIHRIDPFDRGFWPFSRAPQRVDESARPPGPGEEPTAPADDVEALGQRLRTLGSPQVSTLVELPSMAPSASTAPAGSSDSSGSAVRLGLDLAPHLTRVLGAERPGHVLLGLRRLDPSTERSWMRLQLTDLALTTVEEARRVVFAVTSLATAEPMPGAEVRVEGQIGDGWVEIFEGRTDVDGQLAWPVAGGVGRAFVRRITVRAGDDVLVLDAADPPDRFTDGAWIDDAETWLQWTQYPLAGRGAERSLRIHLFTERPVYRPEDPTHFVGWLRWREADGHLTVATDDGWLQIAGPDGSTWRERVEVDDAGAFALRWEGADAPSGSYQAWFETDAGQRVGSVTFRREAYRLPRIEVLLDGPKALRGGEDSALPSGRARLDRPFRVDLVASYYAGGRAAGLPVAWRVTQFPYTVPTPTREGFVWSSDGRFSRTESFRATPARDAMDATDERGGASIEIDPADEPTAQPRSYIVEATVTGVDDQPVVATRRIVALPPFLLGLRTPRWLDPGEPLRPEVLVVDGQGEPVAGQEVTVRLLHRQWHSHLQASDFIDGVARWVTDVVDEPVAEQVVRSDSEPLAVPFDLAATGPGVYVLELEARDRLGRAQVVAVDLYAASGGESPVSWAKPQSATVEVSADAASYAPGDVARLVIQSPFQEARALVVVEAPDGGRTQWVEVRGGEATFEVEIEDSWSPRIPIHVALLRGRLEGVGPRPGSALDLGRPMTLAATRWLEIEPRAQQVEVELEVPELALPGTEAEIVVRLRDPDGAPLAGRVALWLVDRAVLALGKEQRLDPLPSFLQREPSRISLRDTRGLVFGDVPWVEIPGGGEGVEASSLLDRQTVRRNFDPVPFFAANLSVDATGELRLSVPVGDALTELGVRVKAMAGAERFGFASDRLPVRLPVIVQPALPRFVRPGDAFVASGIGRLVMGDPSAGTAEIAVEGLTLDSDASGDGTASTRTSRPLQWLPDRPVRLDFPVRVDDESAAGEPLEEVVVRLGVERAADGAGDAFEVRLPVRPARSPAVRREIRSLEPGETWTWQPPEGETTRLERTVDATVTPALLPTLAAFDALIHYPYGCTEQRLAQARAFVALGGSCGAIRGVLPAPRGDRRPIRETIEWLDQVTGDDGLVSYWPGSRGYVSLTAWSLQFLAGVRDRARADDPVDDGVSVPDELFERQVRALHRALRSDARTLLPDAAWTERTMALAALVAADRADPAYAAELTRRAAVLDAGGMARVLWARAELAQASSSGSGSQGSGSSGGDAATDSADLQPLIDRLWRQTTFRTDGGQTVFTGLRSDRVASIDPLVLPSEVRSLAETVRALARVDAADPRIDPLVAGLLAMADDQGWGSTQADASALEAVCEVAAPRPGSDPGAPGSDPASTSHLRGDAALSWRGATSTETVWADRGLERRRLDVAGPVELRWAEAAAIPVTVRAVARFVPAGDPAAIEAEAQGYVVERSVARVEGQGAGSLGTPVRLDQPTTLRFPVGVVLEERVRVVVPQDRAFVAVTVPLAAGIEPLDPGAATATAAARPARPSSIPASAVDYRDDHVGFYFDSLPKGTHELVFRSRVSLPGSFVQPPARAQSMYDMADWGQSAAARVEIRATTTSSNPAGN